MSVEQMTQKMISTRVSKGYNLADTTAQLEETIMSVSNSNLAYALEYEGFGNLTLLNKFAEAIA